MDWDAVVAELTAFGERHRSRIVDVSLVLQRQMAQGYSILFEGAQATLLDLDHGTYPFVTCSAARPAAPRRAAASADADRRRARRGEGLLHARRHRSVPDRGLGRRRPTSIRERGGEYGATTGRPRRCGWFDAVAVRYATRINGFDALAITKLDVLDELDAIPICTGYRFEGKTLEEWPSDTTILEACEPVYETMPGWKAPTAGVREWGALPDERPEVPRATRRAGRHRDRSRLDRPRPRADADPRAQRARELVRLEAAPAGDAPRARGARATIALLPCARSSTAEREPFKLEVLGSNPSGRTNALKALQGSTRVAGVGCAFGVAVGVADRGQAG